MLTCCIFTILPENVITFLEFLQTFLEKYPRNIKLQLYSSFAVKLTVFDKKKFSLNTKVTLKLRVKFFLLLGLCEVEVTKPKSKLAERIDFALLLL